MNISLSPDDITLIRAALGDHFFSLTAKSEIATATDQEKNLLAETARRTADLQSRLDPLLINPAASATVVPRGDRGYTIEIPDQP